MNTRTLLAALVSSSLAAPLSACGSDASGSGAATTTSSSTGTATGTGTGTGGGGICPGPLDGGAPFPVTIRLNNKSAANLYLGQTTAGCATGPGFTLEDASGNALKASLDVCEITCAELMLDSCVCAADCAAPVVTLVTPGAHVDLHWDGYAFVAGSMPAHCYADPNCAEASCLVPVIPTGGPPTVHASAYTTATGCSGACTDCAPDASGTCIMSGAMTVGGTEMKGEASLSGMPALVEIDFH